MGSDTAGAPAAQRTGAETAERVSAGQASQHSVLTGVGVGRGSAVGVVVKRAPAVRPPEQEEPVDNLDQARSLVHNSFSFVASMLRDRATATVETTLSSVLEANSMMAEDPGLIAEVDRRMDDGAGPATAVDQAVEGFVKILEMGGGYMAERAGDLRDIRDRIVARVLGAPEPGIPETSEPSVVVAEELAPAEMATLDLSHVVAIVTELGGPTSHTAIIAAQLDLPCLVQVDGAMQLTDGSTVAVDAAAGALTVDPDAQLRSAVRRRARAHAALRTATTGRGRTRDGTPIRLLANVGSVEQAVEAAAEDVEGIGLFRTETLFMHRTVAPSIPDQVEAYQRVFAVLGDRRVVIRTLDAGADKPLAFAQPPDREGNPALGMRGLRTARRYPELLDDQLTAIARAAEATGSRPWVMAPMVSTVPEATSFAADVQGHGLPFVGIMIEVPAAALRARDMIARMDFASIGTNDLTQYTMASDRMAGGMAELLDPWQPAVLDLIAITGATGLRADKPIGVCGEAARDPLLALVLVGMGITSLSMAPIGVAAVRFSLSRTDLSTCQEMAEAARAASDAASARSAVERMVDPDVLLAI